ncbi:RNA polymerase II transcription factor SIII subunit A-domain-containing protein [Mortierella sp. GBAus27b]|nr:RNA polymerase II transcription factor SIII subunit A-domain-containing protein [Mortierella sp. GBAus27b]
MAFSGPGHRLGSQDSLPTSDSILSAAPTANTDTGHVASLKDICLSTLDRYIDLLDDIGTTPYYLIESVLKKCNVKQLERIEQHSEGLSEMTDELWYIHARNDFEVFRESARHYDHSGKWRLKYYAMKQEVEDRFERRRAQLRQSYSNHDKVRQDRRVIMDPNLRLPKRGARIPFGSSSWSSVGPKKSSLFEKARLEARKVSQIYRSNPYPPPGGRVSAPVNTSHFNGTAGQPRDGGRRIIAPTSTFNQSTAAQTTAVSRSEPTFVSTDLSSQAATAPNRTKRYSYKSRPVVYMGVSKPSVQRQAEDMASPLPGRVPIAHQMITPSAPGAIVDFFKEINPGHSHHVTTSFPSSKEAKSRSPTSPLQSPSKTIQDLREDAAFASRYNRPHGDTTQRSAEPGPLMKKAKMHGDLRWLEDDDTNDNDSNDSSGRSKLGDGSKKDVSKAMESIEEAGLRFFNQVWCKRYR